MSITMGCCLIVLAAGADAENLEVVPLNREIRVSREIRHEALDRARGETHHRPARRADEVMAMAGDGHDVGGIPRWLQQSAELTKRGEDFEGAVNSRAADPREFGDDLLGRKRFWMEEHRGNDEPSGFGRSVSVLAHGGDCARRSRGDNAAIGRFHWGRVAQDLVG